MVRHLLRDDDLDPDQQRAVLARALELKANGPAPVLSGQAVAIIFDQASTRTRVSFSVGVHELGALPLVLDAGATQAGRGEPVTDMIRVLDRQVAAIVWRTRTQETLETAAAVAGVPVLNALSDLLHPCQALADLLTIAEHRGGLAPSGPALAGRRLAYLGDGGNNMAHSYLLAGATAGLDVHIACPPGFRPRPDIMATAQQIAATTGTTLRVTSEVAEAVAGADALATDTWVSMGDEDEEKERVAALTPYRVDAAAMDGTNDAIFLHCLPAYRGLEVMPEVIDGPDSVVWDEAENRLHAQQAVLLELLEPDGMPARQLP